MKTRRRTVVRIRLERRGKRGRPFYRLVVMDAREKRSGRVLDILGYYDPLRPGVFKVDLAKVEEWLAKGAQPTDRAKSVIRLAQRQSKEAQK